MTTRDHFLSVVIPALNEATQLPETLRHVRTVAEVLECIVVDGGSTDATRSVAESAGCLVLVSPTGRGTQLRIGAQVARGSAVLLLHADTWLPAIAGQAIAESLRDPQVVGGGFWKIFRDPHWLMRGSRWRCWTRLHWFGRIAGDQAMFVRRDQIEAIGGIPDVPLMEEFELCRRLRPLGRLVLANATVSTSARRWRQRGVLSTYLRMWRVTTLYYLGRSPAQLAELYRR